MHLHRFTPGRRFVKSPHDQKCVSIHIPNVGSRALHLFQGLEIFGWGSPVAPGTSEQWFFNEHAAVVPKPEADPDLALNVIHLFAGAFAGWEQAASGLPKARIGQSIGQQIAVDRDDVVMATLAQKHGIRCYRTPVATQTVWNPSPFVGVHGSVDDFSILNLCLNRGNVIATLSPPRPTWSRAGKSKGLNHEGGRAFFEALELCFVIQPVFIAAECVDDIMSHPHYMGISRTS